MCSEEQNTLIVPKLAMSYHCTSCERSLILSLAFIKRLLEVSPLQTVLPTVLIFSSTNILIRNYFGVSQAIARGFPYINNVEAETHDFIVTFEFRNPLPVSSSAILLDLDDSH